MIRKMKNNENYLDYVFERKKGLSFSVDDSGEVVVTMKNTGFSNRIAQRFFKKPKVSRITLEGMGSFIFLSLDGKKTVYDVGREVSERFGKEAEPLYERLCVYMKRLQEAGFVSRVFGK